MRLLQPQPRSSYEGVFVGLALTEDGRPPAGEFRRDPNVLEVLAKLANEFPFTNLRVSARSLCPVQAAVQALEESALVTAEQGESGRGSATCD
jgi:hypothetical protein